MLDTRLRNPGMGVREMKVRQFWMPDFVNHRGGPYPLLDSTERQTAKLHTYTERTQRFEMS